MTTEQTIYHAYLLRLWCEEHNSTGPAHWRASLEDSHTGLRLGFATLEQLFAYLMEVSEGGARLSPSIVDAEEESCEGDEGLED